VVWVEVPLARLDAALAETLSNEMSYSLLLTNDYNIAAGLNLPGQMDLSARSNVLRAFLSQEAVVQARQPMQNSDGAFYVGPDPFDPQMACVVLMNRLPATGWQLISVLPAQTLQSPLERSLIQLVVFALMGIGTLGWVAYTFIGRTISEPLRRLGWAAQEIGSGDLRYAIPYRQQHNEIGRLATALEDMKQNLAHSYSQLSTWSTTLEKRVNERTVELEATQRQAQQNAAELQAVYDAALTVVGDYELNAMLGTLIENILKLLNTSYCAVWLLTADKQHLQLVAATSDKQHLNTLLEINEGLVGTAVRQSKLVIVNEYSQWPDRLEQFIDPTRERVMAAPLLFYKRAIGTVLVGRSREMPTFTPQDERLLTLFANLVSPVVRNAQLYIQREAAREEAERASSVKTRFLASVTHELRTPLNLVINSMDFMRIGAFGEVNDEQRTRLDQAIRSAEHLLYLINDLLDVSKIEAGEMELLIQPGDLRRVLDDALDAAAMMIERVGRALQLRSDIPDTLPSVPMDARRVRQVLTNLLSNAVKFTDAGVITLSARVLPPSNGAANGAGGGIELAVSDTGMGIAADEMGKLFQAFERTDRSKYAAIEGTGLGLAISRFLVEAHGGTMTVESTVGVGSTFRFTLPLHAAKPEKTAPLTINAAIGVD
ncbi:MAG: GAF domain-containing protein, partial [Anaerolineae bacterium]|nr:GAF domain-containing protein [Anaerolineae bacterium]